MGSRGEGVWRAEFSRYVRRLSVRTAGQEAPRAGLRRIGPTERAVDLLRGQGQRTGEGKKQEPKEKAVPARGGKGSTPALAEGRQ